jgi:hypothetical protein
MGWNGQFVVCARSTCCMPLDFPLDMIEWLWNVEVISMSQFKADNATISPKGILKNTLCIVLTSACYTQCIHAFKPHTYIYISMQIDFHPQSDSIQENKVISHLFLLHHFVCCQLFLTKTKRKKMWCACDTLYNMSRNAMSQVWD